MPCRVIFVRCVLTFEFRIVGIPLNDTREIHDHKSPLQIVPDLTLVSVHKLDFTLLFLYYLSILYTFID